MTQRDIEARIQNLVDGNLAPDERATLLDEIGRDPALLDIYWDYVVLDCAFARLSRSSASLIEEQTVITEAGLRSRTKSHIRWRLGAVAAVLVLTGVLLGLILTPDPPVTATLRMSPGTILDVSHALAGKKSPPPGVLMPGSRAKLEQGTIEITFASGVRSIVRGPADLTLNDEGKLSLQNGTAWFHVPAEASGFKVQTPGMMVTDLGTEFGVRSGSDSRDEVHVFQGKVRARAHYGAKVEEMITIDMARSVNLDGVLGEIPADRAQFLTSLPDSLPHLHWSFDDGPQSAVAQGNQPATRSESGRLDGLENPQAFRTTDGRFGNALATTGAFAQAKSGWSGVAGTAPRTIAHWIKLQSGGPVAQQIIGWGSHLLSPFNPNPAFLTYVRRITPGTVAGVSFGAYCLDGTTPISDDLWHHFAVVYTGRKLPNGKPELFCYLDGRIELMTAGYRTDIVSPEEPGAYSITTNLSALDAIPVTLFPGNWCNDGRSTNMLLALDELYIFEAAITQDQVKNLYQKNKIE